MIRSQEMETLAKKLKPQFQRLEGAVMAIKGELEDHSDGKNLKGAEMTGWLGEIYAKLLLGGSLVADSFEHDVETSDMRV